MKSAMTIWNERYSMSRDWAFSMMLIAWTYCAHHKIETDQEEKNEFTHMMNMGGEL